MKDNSTTQARYAYGILESQTHTYDKYGRLILGTHRQIFEHMKQNPKDFSYTKFELIMPHVCMALGVGLLAFIVISSLAQ